LCGEALYHDCPPKTEEPPTPLRPLPKTVEYRVDSIEHRLLSASWISSSRFISSGRGTDVRLL
jgi:hypothetical protein